MITRMQMLKETYNNLDSITINSESSNSTVRARQAYGQVLYPVEMFELSLIEINSVATYEYYFGKCVWNLGKVGESNIRC